MGIVQSPNYPSNSSTTDILKNIKCNAGKANFTIELVFVEISENGYLDLQIDKNPVKLPEYNNGVIENHTITASGSLLLVNYSQGSDQTRGILLRYDAVFTPAPAPPKKSYTLIIVLSLVGGIIIILLIILGFLYFINRAKRQERERFDFIIQVVQSQKQLPEAEITHLKAQQDQFRIRRKQLHIKYKKPLGSGISSSVYKGFLSGVSPLTLITGKIETQKFCDCKVAVKVPKDFGLKESEQLIREIECMKKIGYNEFVICMLGISVEEEKPIIVFELAQSDLLEYVRLFQTEEFKENIPVDKFSVILWQVANGMQFIASKKIIHRDLAARNILLTENLNVKITDFGLAIIEDSNYDDLEKAPKKLPFKWLSLEALLDLVFSEKSDVWAFGVLAFEVFSLGQVPYQFLNKDELVEFLKNGKRLDRPELANTTVYDITLSCWLEEVEARPNFEALVNQLRDVVQESSADDGYLLN